MTPDELVGFYADPVDEDGNVIGHAWFSDLTSPWGPIPMVKIPASEIVADPERTIRARMPEEDA